MSSEVNSAKVSLGGLHAFCVKALEKCGVSESNADITAAALVTTDSWGVHTHGCGLLPKYVKRLRAGGIRADATPAVVAEEGAWALVDGGAGLGQVTSTFAMRLAVEKARSAGLCYVGVRNNCHFGAAGYYAWLASQENMVGIAMANDTPTVAAPGSRKAITGSNPIAYAVPAGDRDPILLDIAISTVSGGKVYKAHRMGNPIPDGWLVGPDGLPTTDPEGFPHNKALTPMAGYKGYGLALLIETLSAAITGAALTWQVKNWIFDDPSQPTHHGAAFLVFNVASFSPLEDFFHRVGALIDEIHQSPTADGQRIFLPGEMEWEKRRRAQSEGLTLPPDIAVGLKGLAEELKIDTQGLL
jgi:ureidoglycolate dehydrogenase (NAD+)